MASVSPVTRAARCHPAHPRHHDVTVNPVSCGTRFTAPVTSPSQMGGCKRRQRAVADLMRASAFPIRSQESLAQGVLLQARHARLVSASIWWFLDRRVDRGSVLSFFVRPFWCWGSHQGLERAGPELHPCPTSSRLSQDREACPGCTHPQTQP